MAKITLYGLSASGKTCYLTAMSQSLSRGIDMGDRSYFTAICPNPFQQALLDSSFGEMTNGKWPKGNVDKPMTYSFDLSYCLRMIQSIDITDYRGALLNTTNPTEAEASNAIREGARGSGVLLFFIGADVVVDAMNYEPKAMAQIGFCNTLHAEYRRFETNWEKTPMMIVISKADIFDTKGIDREKAKEFVINRLQSFFGRGTKMTVGITMVSLGRNLQHIGEDELSGELVVGGTAGNLHIPLLYSAYNFFAQEIERVTGELQTSQTGIYNAKVALEHELGRSSVARFFVNNETSIRNALDSYRKKAYAAEQQKQDMITVFAKIGTMLKAGADIYVDGEQL